jgi:uncharacterized protein (DUF2237 family)
MRRAKNVLGEELAECSRDPLTGFYRTGCCDTGGDDDGVHIVCAQMTSEFLAFSVDRGNDLVTPRPEYGVPGLKPGDRWCLCVTRWKEALEAGMAPPVLLDATHISSLEFVELEDLKRHALSSR